MVQLLVYAQISDSRIGSFANISKSKGFGTLETSSAWHNSAIAVILRWLWSSVSHSEAEISYFEHTRLCA